MRTLYDYHSHVTGPGPWHQPASALPETPPAALPVRALAYYLPQFHREPVNDTAWGTGFTEWTNVTRALPRYRGHVQPRLPADLGFYDLSHADILRRQADLAKRAGLAGFCIHDYWFSGTKALGRPLEVLLDTPDIDLNFCLDWANENWTRRWDGRDQEVILAQEYAPEDAAAYIDSIARALRDPRYIRVNCRPLLMIYRPANVPDAAALVEGWRARAREIGIGELYIVMAQSFGDLDPRPYGIDAAAGFPPHPMRPRPGLVLPQRLHELAIFDRDYIGRVYSYDEMAAELAPAEERPWHLMPGVFPSWDNEARLPGRSRSFFGATPAKYGAWLEAAARMAARHPEPEGRILFVNAWNEWAEGAVLEPCRYYGHAFLAETRAALERVAAEPGPPPARLVLPADDRTPARYRAEPGLGNRAVNSLHRRWRGLQRRLGLRRP